MIKSIPSFVINFVSDKVELSTGLFSSFASKFDFKTWSHEIVVSRETEMPHVSLLIKPETGKSKEFSGGPVDVSPAGDAQFIEHRVVLTHLFL